MEYFKLVYKWYGEGFTSFPHIDRIFRATVDKIWRSRIAVYRMRELRQARVEGRTLYVTGTGLVCIALVLSVWRSRNFAVIATCAALMVIVGITYVFSF